MVKRLGLLMLKEEEFLALDSCSAFVERLNQQLVEDSHSDHEFACKFIKLHDLIKLDDQLARVQIDPMKFALFLQENKKEFAK